MSRPPRIVLVTLLLAGLLAGGTGCRTLRPDPAVTERFVPLYDKGEVRSQLQRARRIEERTEGVEQAVARAAVTLWKALEALYAAPPEAPADARAREAAIVSAYLRQVEAASRAAEVVEPDPPGTDPPRTEVELMFVDYYNAAMTAQEEGRFGDALTVVESLNEEMEGAGIPMLRASSLMLRTGLFHLALGQYDEARAAFARVQELREEGNEQAERARLLQEEIDLLLTLPAGRERDDLAVGWALLELGEMDRAGDLARQVQERTEDLDLQREASFLLAAAQRAQSTWIEELADRARVDITDGAPFEIALQSARALDGGPEPAPSRAREIRAAVEEAEAAQTAMVAASLQEQWAAARDEAQALVAAEQLRAAVALYERFAGTELEEQARAEQARTADILVREERRRAGDLFVAAQKEGDATRRRALLEEAAEILQGLLDDFPDSGYADRVRRNLVAVEEALGTDPG